MAADSGWGFDRDGAFWEAGNTDPTGTIMVPGKKGYELKYRTNESGGDRVSGAHIHR